MVNSKAIRRDSVITRVSLPVGWPSVKLTAVELRYDDMMTCRNDE